MLNHPKILFIHGLESGPGGSKDQYLQNHFESVYTPNMQMSLFRLNRSNSVLRNIFRLPLFWGWFAMFPFGLYVLPQLDFWVVFGVLVLFVGAGFLLKKTLFQQALWRSLEHCILVQKEAITSFQPELILASSWGALVALFCVERGFYGGKVVLIAPPLKLFFERVGKPKGWEDFCQKFSQNQISKMLVIHGDQDEVVPLEDSKLFVQKTGLELRVLAGDHRLNSTLLEDKEKNLKNPLLKEILLEVYQT